MPVDTSMRVLIVDDYDSMLKVLRGLLRQLNFVNVDEASDGAQALAMLRRGGYGLVISDWNMEPMDGIELLRAVRADPDLKELPFVMVTAETKAENIVAARRAGVSNYIVKPFNAATLRSKLATVLGEF